MDAKLKADWVAALRSGEYEQGVGEFESEGKFCCLGVLCKVAGEPTNTSFGCGNWKFANLALGVPENDPPTSIKWTLVSMNDIEDYSFREIADYIEANIPADEHSVS